MKVLEGREDTLEPDREPGKVALPQVLVRLKQLTSTPEDLAPVLKVLLE